MPKGTIHIADVHGFCSGVKRAVEIVRNAVETGPLPVRVLHEIVHNKHVVSEFREKGVDFYDEPETSWTGGTLILSAHGIGSELEKQVRSLPVHLIDATCPLVKQIHHHAVEFERQGFQILFIGKKAHRETEGVAGRLNTPPNIFENAGECRAFQPGKGILYACLTQTTLSSDECSEMIEILKSKIPGLEVRSGICQATAVRQNAVKALCKKCSRIIVIGDSSSSNSKRLYEIAKAAGVQAVLADSADAVPESFLRTDGDIGVTGGASAPEYLLEALVRRLQDKGFTLPDC